MCEFCGGAGWLHEKEKERERRRMRRGCMCVLNGHALAQKIAPCWKNILVYW